MLKLKRACFTRRIWHNSYNDNVSANSGLSCFVSVGTVSDNLYAEQDNWNKPRSALIDHKSPQIETVGALVPLHPLSSRSSYVEKKTCECAVQAARVADTPWTIGAGLEEIGFTLESFTSSCSILRCS
jgi:hypothetical protein